MTPPARVGSLTELVAAWLPRQRWFAGKGQGTPRVELAAQMRLAGPGEAGESVLSVVTATSGDTAPATYQVPLTLHPHPVPGLEHALLGVLEPPDGRPRWVYDGPHDPLFVQPWLRLLLEGADSVRLPDGEPVAAAVTASVGHMGPGVAGTGTGGTATGAVGAGTGTVETGVVTPGTASTTTMLGEAAGIATSWARGVRLGRGPAPTASARVLHGEQSNTSLIVDGDGAAPVIVKLFRLLQDGANPDVVVQPALAAAGCDRVPRPVGWLEGTWSAGSGPVVHGHLAYACEYLPGSEDGWQLACAAVGAGKVFTAEAQALGAATAGVHAALRQALPTRATGATELAALAANLMSRLRWAVHEAPQLDRYAGHAIDLVQQVRGIDSAPPLQQIHGDFHLGQVLRSPGRGWVLLDFEGEPLRPLAERMRPDLALRDVAGMLRSFDYAAGHACIGATPGEPRLVSAASWVQDCREAFLNGYTEVAGRDPRADAVLLAALELDKAFYEVVYEARNRPDWVEIPLSAVRRLVAEG